MSYYSDNGRGDGGPGGVDDLVIRLLPEFGYACDVGANNGVFNSNSLIFEEKGWLVLCIEANPLLAEEGRSKRKLWRDVACGPQDLEEAEFWMIGNAPYASSSALAVDGANPYKAARPDCADSRPMVKVRTLDRLLEEAGFPRLDYLTIDVEGYEQEVMAGFTIERWKPQIIVMEDYRNIYLDPIPGYGLLEKRLYDLVYQRKAESA